MAKRIQNKVRSKRSGLKVESLEQRQLLATIVAGSGTEVVSDHTDEGNGNTYDQILLTGSLIAVQADDDLGHITRVDFLDLDGDIVRAELSGPGTLTISLDQFVDAAVPTEYKTTTEYVQGHATFIIEGATADTHFSFYSLGEANVHMGEDNPIFDDGAEDGGDNFADAQAIHIDGGSSIVGTGFGGIRAGNAQFTGASGDVGIIAENVNFSGPIIIQDIDASGTGDAQLVVGVFSPTTTVQVTGGDLVQTNGSKVLVENVATIHSSSGSDSMGDLLDTLAIDDATNIDGAVDLEYSSAAETVTLGAGDSPAAYAGKFLNDVVFEADYNGGDFDAEFIGNVTVAGDLNFVISTSSGNIGNVTVEGDALLGGAIDSAGSVGDVTVEGDLAVDAGLDLDGDAVGTPNDVTFVAAASGDIGNLSLTTVAATDILASAANGSIGNITVTTGALGAITAKTNVGGITATEEEAGGLTLGAVTATEGSIGNISVTGEGDLVLGAALTAGTTVGNISTADGALTVAAITAEGVGSIAGVGGAVTIGGAIAASESGIGDISATDGALIINATVTADEGNIGTLWADGDGADLTVNAVVEATEGAIGGVAVLGENADLVFTGTGAFTAKTSIGDVSVASGAITGTADSVEFTANQIGDVSVTGGSATTTLLTNVVFVAQPTDTTDDETIQAGVESAVIGNITLDSTANGDAVLIGGAAAILDGNDGTGFSSSGSIGNVTITMTDGLGRLLNAATTGFVIRAGSSVLGSATDTAATTADTYALGSDTNGGVSIGDVSISANLGGLGDGTAGTGLVIASGVNISTNGVFASADGTRLVPVQKLGSGNSIGAINITNFGSAETAGFTSGSLGLTETFAAGSVIVADSIGALTVTGEASEEFTATTGPRRGSIGVGTDAEVDDLYVVVL